VGFSVNSMKLIAKVRVADFNMILNFHLSEILQDSYKSRQPAICALTGLRSSIDALYRYMARQPEPQASSQPHSVSQGSCPLARNTGNDPDEYPIDDEDGEEEEAGEAATERYSDELTEKLSADAPRRL